MWKRTLPSSLLLGVLACGDFGANPGGVQDLNFARDLIDQGQIPPPSAFKVEGMLAEHDLPLEGPACAETLCVRGALALAPDEAGEPAGWLQVGLSSTIDPATFQRPPLAIVATVDVSGSMGWGSNDEEHPSPGDLSRRLLSKIEAQLGEADQLAIVTYGSSVDVALPPTNGANHGRIQAVINDLDTNGSTNMEAGLTEAYRTARGLLGQGRTVRIMLFTDEQPNVGATDPGSFEGMAAAGGAEGIGLTVFGLGLGLGTEVMSAMAHVRGANAFSATTLQHLDQLMEQSWPYLNVEIAHQLTLTIEPSGGARIGATYGFPTKEGGPSTSLSVSSVFLSRNRGALLVRFDGTQEVLEAMTIGARLSYLDPAERQHDEVLNLSFAGQTIPASGALYQQRAVHQTVALAVLVRAMEAATSVYPQDRAAALAILDRAITRFTDDQAALADPSFTRELELVQKLRALIDQAAPQGSLYGAT